MSSDLEVLKKKVSDLQELVQKQNLLISKTGKNVLELQIPKQKSDVDNFGPSRAQVTAQFDSTDFATNDDLVQLVAELQGELNVIEERSIRRLVNSTKTDQDATLAPIPNADGEAPSLTDEMFPHTLKEFEEMDDIRLYRLAKFYEKLPLTMKEQEDFDKVLEGKVEDLHISKLSDEDITKELKKLSKDELDDAFNDIARYLGLRSRRGTGIW